VVQLTRHFSLDELTVSETARRLGMPNQPAGMQHMANLRRLAEYLEQVRALWRRPVAVMSAYRSPAVNRAVGGVPTSDHALGLAADIRVDGVAGIEVARGIAGSAALMAGLDQLIWYRPSGAVHVGIGLRQRRQVWTNPTTKAGHRPLLAGIVPG
jgi:putative chitinase